MKSIITLPTVQLVTDDQQSTSAQRANANGNGQKRSFTAIDMWNHNRKVRAARSMVRR